MRNWFLGVRILLKHHRAGSERTQIFCCLKLCCSTSSPWPGDVESQSPTSIKDTSYCTVILMTSVRSRMCFILLMRHLLTAVPPQYLHQVRESSLWCLLPCSDPCSTWVESRDICKVKMNSGIWKHLDWRYYIVSLLCSPAQTAIIYR